MYNRVNAIKSLNKLIKEKHLSLTEAEKLFKYIYLYDKEGLLFSAVTAAIHTKRETPEELAGIIKATRSLVDRTNLNAEVTDTSGTGGGTFKTFNVSTAAAFIVAAAGHKVLKACFKGITSSVGSADVLLYFGIDVFKLSSEKVKFLCEKYNISPYYISSISPKLYNRTQLIKKFFIEEEIKILTPYHLTTNLCTPCPIYKRIYGCFSPDVLETMANTFRILGYKHTLSFSSEIGITELSNSGKTYIVEQKEDNLKSYIVTPEDLGVSSCRKEDIMFISTKQSYRDFIEVLQNKSTKAKIDLVAINAGASLYLTENLPDIRAGVKKAKSILLNGIAYKLLSELRNECERY